MEASVKRGDIFYADLSPVVGSEQGGTRPVLIVQNDTGNRHSPTVIAAAITSRTDKTKLPTHFWSKSGPSTSAGSESIWAVWMMNTWRWSTTRWWSASASTEIDTEKAKGLQMQALACLLQVFSF